MHLCIKYKCRQHNTKQDSTLLCFTVFSSPVSLFSLVQVQSHGQESVFSPEQAMAMLLTYLKTTAENAISTKVADCVISVCVNVQQICQIFMKYC